MSDDVELQRIRQSERRRGYSVPAIVGSKSFYGRNTTVSPVVGQFLNMIPQVITGPEVEGGDATVTDVGSTPIPAYLLGPNVPSLGDQLLATFVANRWVTRAPAGSSSGITCAGCTGIPLVLNCTYQYGTCTPAECLTGDAYSTGTNSVSFTMTYNPAYSYWDSGVIEFDDSCGNNSNFLGACNYHEGKWRRFFIGLASSVAYPCDLGIICAITREFDPPASPGPVTEADISGTGPVSGFVGSFADNLVHPAPDNITVCSPFFWQFPYNPLQGKFASEEIWQSTGSSTPILDLITISA